MKRTERRKRGHEKTGFENWGGYMNAKISKLQNQFKKEAGFQKKGIFEGVAIFVNGYTEPTAGELKQIMINHGGSYHHYKSRNTTHIIASNLPNVKIQSLNNDHTVTPKWITDSLAAEKLLDYKKYLLYPHQSRSQPRLTFRKFEETNNFIKSPPPVSSGEGNIPSNASQNCDIKNESKNTSEEECLTGNNNAVVKSFINTSNTSNPNFISDFYNNSRLHHISTVGAMFKQYVKDLQTKANSFPGRGYLSKWVKKRTISECVLELDTNRNYSSSSSRVIMHIDMDCFFVSVGLLKHPELKNQAVAVTHASKNSQPKRDGSDFQKELNYFKSKAQFGGSNEGSANGGEISDSEGPDQSSSSLNTGRMKDLVDASCSMAEIASCSYEARKSGVKNGMFLGVALKLCPDLKTIPYDFEGYKRVSLDLYDTVASYTKDIEAISCDEMFVDLSDVLKECSVSPLEFASCIREQIQEKTKCSCSAGLGPNMITARMATKKAKPNGQFYVKPSEVLNFMHTQPITDLPGVGGSMRQRLEAEGVKTCGDLQKLSLDHLQSSFGVRTGKSFYDFSRGIDERSINKEHQRKSVSAEINYGIRFKTWGDAENFLSELTDEVAKRLSDISLRGRMITLKLKVRAEGAPEETAKFMGHGICDNLTKSVTVSKSTSDKDLLFKMANSLLKQMVKQPHELRGVGLQVSKLESTDSSAVVSIKKYLSSAKINPFDNQKSSPKLHRGGDLIRESCRIGNVLLNKNEKDSVNEMNCKEKDVMSVELETNQDIVIDSESYDPSKVVDLEVLNALPPDLRSLVIDEYKRQGYVFPSTLKQKDNIHSLSPQPGPSRLSSFVPELLPENSADFSSNNEELITIKEDATDYNDLSISQIDASFLNALPVDVRLDLRSDLRKGKTMRETARLNSLKQQLVSRTHIVKRGRPIGRKSGSSPRKPVVTDPSNHSPNDANLLCVVDNKKEDNQLKDIESGTDFKSSTPNLCGEYDLESIKYLISKWISACPVPEEIDINIIGDFCASLIVAKDLEQLDLVMRFMFRKTKNGSVEWQNGFYFILDRVQEIMMDTYNAPLVYNFNYN